MSPQDIARALAGLSDVERTAVLKVAGVKTGGMSEETKDKIRQSMLAKNWHHTPEAIAKMRAAQLGRTMTEEAKAKLSATMRARFNTGAVTQQQAEIETLRAQLAHVTALAAELRITRDYVQSTTDADAAADDTAHGIGNPATRS